LISDALTALSLSRKNDFSGKELDVPADLHKLFVWLAAVWVVEAVELAERAAGLVAAVVVSAEQVAGSVEQEVAVSAERVADWAGQGDLWEARAY
jgi:hypothetical protein